MNPFVHLHLHTQFSLSEGAISIKNLKTALKEKEFQACAITDHGNMHGVIQFYNQLKSESIKPIIGLGAYITDGDRKQNEYLSTETPHFEINLICLNKIGYQNLIKLISIANNNGKYNGQPRIDFNLLKKYNEGLITLSTYKNSALVHHISNNKSHQAEDYALKFKQIFNERYFIEIQYDGTDKSSTINQKLITLAKQTDIQIVATNNCLYLEQDDAFAQHVLKLMGQQKKVSDEGCDAPQTTNYYLKTSEEMYQTFQDYHPTFLSNSQLIADQCELNLETKQFYLPSYQTQENRSLEEQIKIDADQGLMHRIDVLKVNYQWNEDDLKLNLEKYQKRLDFELDVINRMGYPGYFLIVADFVNWAKSNSISVGPGRGSGAGSLVAYALGITGLDPIQFGLLFERFLNPDRVSLPDFDIDFEAVKRDKVIYYVREKYGEKNVSLISALGRYQAKAALRGVARVLNISLGEANRIANLVPKTPGITLEQTIQSVPEFKSILESGPEMFRNMIMLAQKLEGMNSNLSTHPAGVIIMDNDISDILPTCVSTNTNFIQSQYPMEDSENQGAVKFDFLGLRNLSIIEKTIELIEQTKGETINIDTISIFDPKPYELITLARTMGIFQLESDGIKNLLKNLKPDSFEDWIAVIALYRPGPLGSGMIDDYIECKHGKKEPEYLHEKLEEVLQETYGVMVYQEQVIKVVQILALFTLGEADLFRRAIGKKKEAILLEQKQKFIEGCEKNNVDKNLATKIFDLILKFAEYGFNKSHSAAYAMLGFQTAWLKSHYPIEFMTALLIVESADSDYISKVIDECKLYGIEIVQPDIQKCDVDFSTDGEKIFFGLSAVKNVSKAVVTSIIEERKLDPFKNLFDFFYRIKNTISKRSIEFLIKSGAFDSLDTNRKQIFDNLDHYLSSIRTAQNFENENQVSLFDMLDHNEKKSDELSIDIKTTKDWDFLTKIFYEKEFLGSFFSGHPLDFYEIELQNMKFKTIKQIFYCASATQKDKKSDFNFVGFISVLKVQQNKKMQRYAQITIEDKNDKISGTIYHEEFAKIENIIKEKDVVTVQCYSQNRNDMNYFVFKEIKTLDSKRQNAKGLQITINYDESIQKVHDVIEFFQSIPGDCPVKMEVFSDVNKSCLFEVPYKINLKQNVAVLLNQYLDAKNIIFQY